MYFKSFSTASFRFSGSGLSERLATSNFVRWMWFFPSSRDRMAFSRLSSMVRPMLMVSPVAFIWVPSTLEARVNLSKGNRGIFVTT